MEIIVEGKSDLRFIHYLTNISKKKIIIARGIGNVFNQLEKRKKRQDAIAMIDEDKGKSHPKLWTQKQPFSNRELAKKLGKMQILVHLLWNMKLITLSPDLEEWILKVVEINKINPADFGLSNIPTMLKEALNNDSVSKQEHCKSFVESLMSSEYFQSLKELLIATD